MSLNTTRIVRMKFGSHLYGTNTPQSDTDLKSVHVPNAEEILLGKVRDEIDYGKREKAEGERNTKDDVDDKSYSIAKFLRLAAEGQTVAIDMLFAPPEMILEKSYLWDYIVDKRHKLLTKKSASFLGYCRQQADKYGIKGSRVLAAEVSTKFFESLMMKTTLNRLKVGDHDAELRALASEHAEHLKVLEKETTPGRFETFFECCGRKIPYNATIVIGWQTCKRVSDEYGDRAQKAKENKGVDWKALSHAVRVGYEAVELLRTNHVVLPLRKAEHVRNIKLGNLPYQQVSEEIEDLLAKIEDAAERSTLPDEPDQEFIKSTILIAHASQVRGYNNGRF